MFASPQWNFLSRYQVFKKKVARHSCWDKGSYCSADIWTSTISGRVHGRRTHNEGVKRNSGSMYCTPFRYLHHLFHFPPFPPCNSTQHQSLTAGREKRLLRGRLVCMCACACWCEDVHASAFAPESVWRWWWTVVLRDEIRVLLELSVLCWADWFPPVRGASMSDRMF